MAVPEAIMICIDNSITASFKPSLLQAQKDAIQLYCEAKLNSNPANLVGLATMGTYYYSHIVHPTRDVDKFQAQLQLSTNYNNAGGSLHLFNAVINAQFVFRSLKSKTMNKRQLIFVVGPITSTPAGIKSIAASLKAGDIAVDFVCVECDDHFDRLTQIYGFDALKEAVDGNKKNHFVHVPRGYSVCDVLLRSKILPSNFQKQKRKSLAASARSLSLEEDTTWLKNKADAVAIEDVEPTEMSDENNMLFVNSEIKKTPPLSLKESQEKTKKKKKQNRKGKKHATAAAEYVDPGDTKAFVQELEKLKQKVGSTLAQELEMLKQKLEACTSRNNQVG